MKAGIGEYYDEGSATVWMIKHQKSVHGFSIGDPCARQLVCYPIAVA